MKYNARMNRRKWHAIFEWFQIVQMIVITISTFCVCQLGFVQFNQCFAKGISYGFLFNKWTFTSGNSTSTNYHFLRANRHMNFDSKPLTDFVDSNRAVAVLWSRNSSSNSLAMDWESLRFAANAVKTKRNRPKTAKENAENFRINYPFEWRRSVDSTIIATSHNRYATFHMKTISNTDRFCTLSCTFMLNHVLYRTMVTTEWRNNSEKALRSGQRRRSSAAAAADYWNVFSIGNAIIMKWTTHTRKSVHESLIWLFFFSPFFLLFLLSCCCCCCCCSGCDQNRIKREHNKWTRPIRSVSLTMPSMEHINFVWRNIACFCCFVYVPLERYSANRSVAFNYTNIRMSDAHAKISWKLLGGWGGDGGVVLGYWTSRDNSTITA